MSSFDPLAHPASNPSTISPLSDNDHYHQNGMIHTEGNQSIESSTNDNNNTPISSSSSTTTMTTTTNGVHHHNDIGSGGTIDNEVIELRYLIDGSHVGAIIGKSGITVKNIRESSGAFLSIHQKDGRANERIMMVKGTIDQQVRAAELICISLIDAYKEKRDALLNTNTNNNNQSNNNNSTTNNTLLRDRELAHGTNDTSTILRLLVHKSHVGAVIGRGGITIKEIQSHTGAKIQVSNDALPLSTEKSITFTGTPQSISTSLHSALIEMKQNPMKSNIKMTYYQPGNALFQSSANNVSSLVPFAAAAAAASNSPFLNPSLLLASQTLGFATAAAAVAQQQSQRIAIPTVCAGLLIGRSGQTIKGLRTQSGCHIQIADPEINSPNERVVTITGTQPGINQAILLIRQLVERYVPPTLSTAGLAY